MMMIILVDEKRPRCLEDSLDSIIPVAVSLLFTDYMGLFPQDAELLDG